MPAAWSACEAGPTHTQALCSLLPELMSAAAWPPRSWLAYEGDQRHRIIAAATMEPRLHAPEGTGFRAQIRVLPAWRRRGIGQALLLRLSDHVRAWGVDRLHTWHAAESAATEGFLRASGFMRQRAVHHFVGELSEGLRLCEQRVARLRAHDRVPPRFATLPLAQLPLDAVAALYQRQIGGPIASVLQHLRARLACEPCRSLSMAAWDGEQLAGFLLTGTAIDVPNAELWVSDPRWRHGWPAALTLHATLQRVAVLGATQYRFHCDETVHATMNFARRSGARLEATRHHWVLPLHMQDAP